MYLHKMDQIISPPFCEYQDLNIKEVHEKMDEITTSMKKTLSFQTNILK
jgi:hypothetical protein